MGLEVCKLQIGCKESLDPKTQHSFNHSLHLHLQSSWWIQQLNSKKCTTSPVCKRSSNPDGDVCWHSTFCNYQPEALKSPDASLENFEVLLVSQSSIATHPEIVLTGAQTSKPTLCDATISLPLQFGFPLQSRFKEPQNSEIITPNIAELLFLHSSTCSRLRTPHHLAVIICLLHPEQALNRQPSWAIAVCDANMNLQC